MSVSLEQLREFMNSMEGENLEFKEASTNYHFERLAKYCAALSNEGGGKMVLGVTDQRPRRVVGSRAFRQPERTRRGLLEAIALRIDCSVVGHPDGRVLVFDIPEHPIGIPIAHKGIYWARGTDGLVPMSPDRLRSILAEGGKDFSADTCAGASIADLDARAIEEFRRRWIDRAVSAGNEALAGRLANLPAEQLLRDIEAVVDDGITFAALALFGTRKALGKHLGQSEIIFEYRSSEASGPAQHRQEYRQGFFSFYDDLWQVISLRNDVQHYQAGLFVFDIPTFAERTVREAILNAVSHRDYQLGGSVFIRQYARRLVVQSPGGFPPEVNLDNILDRQSPRNRRIADIFAKCGLVERSGQGMNLMFEQSIQQGKSVPDFAGTDQYQVVLTLDGQIRDPRFVQFLEKVDRETLDSFTTRDFLVLDLVHREQTIPDHLRPRLQELKNKGIVESISRGRGTRCILSRRYHAFAGEKGHYTRKRGLDRETNKALLLKHVQDNPGTGSKLGELTQVLPALSTRQVQRLLRELRARGHIHNVGVTRGTLWYPGASGSAIVPDDCPKRNDGTIQSP